MSDRIEIFGGDRALLLKVRNIPEVVASKGAIAALAQKAAPEAIEAKVYEEMAKQLKEKLREQRVETDVKIVQASGFAPAESSGVLRNLAIGLGVVGIAGAVFYAVKR